MKLTDLTPNTQQLQRLAEILSVLRRYDLADWLKRIPHDEIRKLLSGNDDNSIANLPWETRVRLALTDLGTTFIKLGQILSSRPDLIGPALAQELETLQSGTPPDPASWVRETIQADLGDTPDKLFEAFQPEAFASASIGQVHRAALPADLQVVVKVQHRGIEEAVRQDIDLMQILAKLLQDHVPATNAYQPVATVREFRRTILRELDFANERRNLQQFARNFEDDDTVHIPVAYPQRSGSRVLTMEYLAGIPGSDQSELHAAGANLKEFSRRAANMYLHMIFRDGFYHADPHPGNYMLLPGNVVGLLDCGMVGHIDDQLRETFEDLVLSLLQHDSQGLSDQLLRLTSASTGIDRRAFRTDVGEFLVEYSGVPIKDLELGVVLEQMTGIIRRHHLILPSSISMLLKTLIMLEGTARQLDPDFSLAELLEPVHEQLVKERMRPKHWMRKASRAYRDWDRLITNSPRDLADVLEGIREGKLKIKHEHEGLQASVNRLVAGILIAALFVGSSLLWSRSVPPIFQGVSLPGASGFALATFLGFRLWRTLTT